MTRANGKMTQKYAKLKKWPKITFRGLILVPEVVLKSGLRILIRAPEVPFLVPPKLLKCPVLAISGVPEMALRVPKSKFRDHFSIQTSPQKPPQEPKSDLEK